MQRLEQARESIFGGGQVYLSVRDRDGASVFQSEDWPETIVLPETVELLPGASELAPPSTPRDLDFRRGPPQGGGGGRQLFENGNWHFETLRGIDERWRLGLLSTSQHEYRILVSLASMENNLAALRWRLAAVLLPAMILLVGGGWAIAGRAIRPLKNISSAAEKIVGGQFHERIEPAEKAPEIDHIIGLLNRMLDRLETNYRQALRFSADASHELKTPITLMQNALVNQLNSVTADGPDAQFCTEMLEHLSRIKRLTEGLLLLARADSGELPKASKAFDLAELCRELCADVRSLAELETTGGSWEESIPATVPVFIDPSFVRTVIFNLLVNAMRYCGHPGRIQVELTANSETACFAVTNNGDAITPADQAHIFSRFYRGSNAKDSPNPNPDNDSGSGLGLAIARELATVLGGELILLYSKPDATRFEFSFPLQAPTNAKMNKN
ncbi:MAG: sensor histidine kinase [Puniceicoccaceae bacterium]|nr:MAG: sensor histidine kinase [Puniceicoccaceae bacterium]